jgi:hypothetical protein
MSSRSIVIALPYGNLVTTSREFLFPVRFLVIVVYL